VNYELRTMDTEATGRRGLILINTGPGKGKTTAALGTALRAVGCGMRVLVLDEINYAINYKMLDVAAVAEALKAKPEMVHVILTGRNAHPLLVELADTVTEMREVKHAYQKGILAQRGIEY